jgi:MFS family permease
MRTTAYAVCGSAPLTVGFALYPALVPLAVAQIGWQWSFSLMVAPLLLVSALAALTLPRIASGRDVDEN